MDRFEFKAHMSKYTDAWVARLREVFNKYCNDEYWKDPFMVLVYDEEEKDMLVEAISFYMADVAEVRPDGGDWWVICHGYQAN